VHRLVVVWLLNMSIKDLTRSRNTLQATADSLRERDNTMQRQLEKREMETPSNETELACLHEICCAKKRTLSTRLKTTETRNKKH